VRAEQRQPLSRTARVPTTVVGVACLALGLTGGPAVAAEHGGSVLEITNLSVDEERLAQRDGGTPYVSRSANHSLNVTVGPTAEVPANATQSGETADTLDALEVANAAGARSLAVTNVLGSSATRLADDALFIRAGPETGVGATVDAGVGVAVAAVVDRSGVGVDPAAGVGVRSSSPSAVGNPGGVPPTTKAIPATKRTTPTNVSATWRESAARSGRSSLETPTGGPALGTVIHSPRADAGSAPPGRPASGGGPRRSRPAGPSVPATGRSWFITRVVIGAGTPSGRPEPLVVP
jgi:hypothetical protein